MDAWPPRRPPGRPAGFQRWRHLLFLHWRVEPARVQALLPPELAVETHDGAAFVGVVPFTMRDVAPSWAPPVPGISHFHELNVRTYVTCGAVSGVWFFSLDAAGSVAVLAARAGWGLPYHRARMSLAVGEARIAYRSKRLWPKPRPAELAVAYRVGSELAVAPGTVEHFLIERYRLFARGRRGLRTGRVHHRPYPVRAAHVERLEQSVTAAAGLADLGEPAFAHYSPGVDVDVYPLEPALQSRPDV